MLIPVNEHFEHGGYRYWRYTDKVTGELLHKKRDISTGRITIITQDEYGSALASSHKTASASSAITQTIQAPKPTKREIDQLSKHAEIELTTKSGKKFTVKHEGKLSALRELPVSPSYLIENVLGTFVDTFSPVLNKCKVESEFKQDYNLLSIKSNTSIDESDPLNHNKWVALCRDFKFYKDDRGIEVKHELFQLPKQYQNAGLSKKIMKEALDFYESLGVSKVRLEASLENGPYVWAKYGFVPEDKAECSSLAYKLASKLKALPEIFPPDSDIFSELSEHIKKLGGVMDENFKYTVVPDPTAIRLIADYKKLVLDEEGKPIKAGKALLFERDKYKGSVRWYGVADLKDPDTLDRWKNYCNTGIKKSKGERHMADQNQNQNQNQDQVPARDYTDRQLAILAELEKDMRELYASREREARSVNYHMTEQTQGHG